MSCAFPSVPLVSTTSTPLFVSRSGIVRVIEEGETLCSKRRLMKQSVRNLSDWILSRTRIYCLDEESVFSKIEESSGLFFDSAYPFSVTMEKLVAINDAINSFIS